jgi:hypothetical protein
MGHDATIVKDTDLQKIKNVDDIDVFSPSFYGWLPNVIDFCKRLGKNTKILLYVQSLGDCRRLFNLGKKCFIVGVSDYVKIFYHSYDYPYKTIYNAVNDEIFTNNDLDYASKKGNFVFFASYERPAEYGIANALCVLIGGFSSNMFAGYVSDKYESANYQTKSYVAVGMSAICIPVLLILFLVNGNFYFSITMLFLDYLLCEGWISPIYAMI